MPDTKVHITKDKWFEYGYTATPDQFVGKLEPWRPHWWAQYLGDGTLGIFDSRADMREWMRKWHEIDE